MSAELPHSPVVLCVLDGFGCSKERRGNAIAHAEMPHYRALVERYPYTELGAAQEAVGLPRGQQGNSEVGQGRMEITEAAPSRVAMDLDFVKPFEAHNKVVHVVFDMDGMVGKQFETGLANLKAVAEK